MVHCQECRSTLSSPDDIAFRQVDSSLGFIAASKRFYVAECAHCGAAIGSGVAGAKTGGDGAAH